MASSVHTGGSRGWGKVPIAAAGQLTSFAPVQPSGRSTASPLGVEVMVDPEAPSGYVYVAPDLGVATSGAARGVKLAAGDSYSFAVRDASALYAIADTDAMYLAWEAANDG